MRNYTVTLNEVQVDLIMGLIAYGLNAHHDSYTQEERKQLDDAYQLLDGADSK